jgi:hypothetical protein
MGWNDVLGPFIWKRDSRDPGQVLGVALFEEIAKKFSAIPYFLRGHADMKSIQTTTKIQEKRK